MLNRWNEALEVIETNLHTQVDVAELARTALTSEYHFRRVFSVLAGMPLSEYVRRRRITVATAAVLGGERILDVAVRHGYSSADAFSRAFTALHGMTPEQARRSGAVLRSQPRIRFRLTVEGAHAMHHRITELDAFRLVGRCASIPLVYEGENPAMVAFETSLPKDLDEQLGALSNVRELPGVVSGCTGFEEGRADGSTFDYYHAVASATAADRLPGDLDVLEVPAGTWAVFETRADGQLQQALQQLWAEAFGQWFPSNPYRIVPGPEILRVTDVNDEWTSGRGQLWIPVERDADGGRTGGDR